MAETNVQNCGNCRAALYICLFGDRVPEFQVFQKAGYTRLGAIIGDRTQDCHSGEVEKIWDANGLPQGKALETGFPSRTAED